ncbi:protein kinase, putative [Bodo saltans]|uniref:Protein kinase, putative n=1 Tax=Bodo saltans TaxID=75058 RepID=A0A0S4JPZ4_BODSA|nr:protein kinase, putative [Bodo saltans]|eukprot:CUG92764.1 protein kinase, putative [Bodo saltans]
MFRRVASAIASRASSGTAQPVPTYGIPLASLMSTDGERHSSQQPTDVIDPSQRAKDDADFLISIARLKGCFRVRYVFMLLTLLAALQLMFFWGFMVNSFEDYLQRASSDVCTSSASMVGSQLGLFQAEVQSRMRIAANLVAAVVADRNQAASSSSINATTNFPNETFYQTDMCDSFYRGFLALAVYYLNGTRMFYTPCVSYLDSPTLSTEQLPLVTERAPMFRFTSLRYTIMFAAESNITDPNATDTGGATYIIMLLLTKEVFGWVALGAISPKYSTQALLRATSVMISSDDAPLINTLNSFDTPTYSTVQPTPTAARLLSYYNTYCAHGTQHTWYTGTVARSKGLPVSLPATFTPEDGSVAVLCGLLCIQDNLGNCISQEVRIVVETPISDTTNTISAFKLVGSCIGGIAIFLFFCLTLSITVPVNVLNHRIIAVLSGEPWRKTRTERLLILVSRRFWIRDVVALLQQFHIMALFFTANRKYVPDFVLHHQMDVLRGDREIEKLLSSLTLEDWAGAAANATVGTTSSGGADAVVLGRAGSVGGAAATAAAATNATTTGGSVAAGDQELEMLRHALVAERNHQHHIRAGQHHNSGPQLDDSLPLRGEDVSVSNRDGGATPVASIGLSQSRRPTLEGGGIHQHTASDLLRFEDRADDVRPADGGGVTPQETSENNRNRLGGLMGLTYIESATLMSVMVGSLEDAFDGAFDLTARQHRKIFAAIHTIIRRHHGNMYQQTGERVSVAWNAFEARADHALRAVRCANELSNLFKGFRKEGLRLGIVVHQGPVVCGIIGDNREVASVLFGQASIVLSRLVTLASQLTFFSVLVTEPVKKVVSIFFDCVIVDVIRDMTSGKTISVFDVRHALDLGKQVKRNEVFVVEYTTAFAQFRSHQFHEAIARLTTQLPEASIHDPLVSRLIRLCTYYAAHDRQLPRPYTRSIPQWPLFEADAEEGIAAGLIADSGQGQSDEHFTHREENAVSRRSRRTTPPPREGVEIATLQQRHQNTFRDAVVAHAQAKRQLMDDANKPSSFATELRTSLANQKLQRQVNQHSGRLDAVEHSAHHQSSEIPRSLPVEESFLASAVSLRMVDASAVTGDNAGTTSGGSPPSGEARRSSSSAATGRGGTATAAFENTLIESVGWSLAPGPPPLAPRAAPAAGEDHTKSTLKKHVVPSAASSNSRSTDVSSANRDKGAAAPSKAPSPGQLPVRIVSSQGTVFIRSSRVLGTGSFGCVYMGMEEHSGRLVALKFLPQPTAEGEMRLLQNEVATMETVTHVHLVEFYGYSFADNMIVLVMECLVAGSLSGMLSTFTVVPGLTAVNFMRDVLLGLQRLHSMGIVHRDVKPQNVLIAANGHCKISDFGASASIHELVRRHDGGAEVQGTPIYLSPEAARGHAEPKSDVWSVGIMFLQLITGSIPYNHHSISGGVGAVVFGIGSGTLRPVIPPDLHPLGLSFVQGCLATNVIDRLSAEQLLDLPLFSV